MDLEEQYDKIFRYCYFKLYDRQLAQDITQETFLRYYSRNIRLDSSKELAYLYTIARNLCTDAFRQKPLFPLADADEAVFPDATETLIDSLTLRNALEKLTREHFAVPMPNPQEKARFLRTLPQPSIPMWQFLLTQIAYLRKWALILSVLFLLPTLWSNRHMNADTLWSICAMIPFLALLAVTESTRSTVYGMQEFEMSARFSLKSVLLARMSVLGLLDAFVICCLIPFYAAGCRLSLLQTGLYFLVPYLLTANSSLWLVRRFHGREALYGCLCAAALPSCG